MSAGKGDKLRKGADLNKYWSNYDAIFRKPEEPSLEVGNGLSFGEVNIPLGKSPEPYAKQETPFPYLVQVKWSQDFQKYVARVPALPAVQAVGNTASEAVNKAQETTTKCIEVWKIPAPKEKVLEIGDNVLLGKEEDMRVEEVFGSSHHGIVVSGEWVKNIEQTLADSLDLLRRCRDSAGRMDLDLYQDIQEFLHQNS